MDTNLLISILLVSLGLLFLFAKENNRFLFKVKTGSVFTLGAGNVLQYYVLHKMDYDRILAQIEHLLKQREDKTDPLSQSIRTNLLKWKGKITTETKTTGIFSRKTGWWFTLNPFITTISSDRGKGPVYVNILSSPDSTLTGVELREAHSSGISTVDIHAELQGVFFVDFFRIFFQEESTESQIIGRFEAAARLLCNDRSYEDLVQQQYDPVTVERVVADLVEFGLIPDGDVSIYDTVLSGNVAQLLTEKVEEELREDLLKQIQINREIEAKTEAKKIQIIETAKNEAKKQGGIFEAEVLDKTMGAAKNDPNIVRALTAKHPEGALPTQILAYVSTHQTQQSKQP